MRQRKNNRFMSGEELLHKATGGWKFKTDNKMRGAFGETNFDTKTIKINKKKHTNKKMLARERRYKRNPDGSESMLNTLVHELEHVSDPSASEKKVGKRAAKLAPKLSPRVKKRIYRLVKR